MKELVYIQMDTIDSVAGHNRKYWFENQLDDIKKLPDLYAKNGCLPDKIELRRFVFIFDINVPIELSVRAALNCEAEKLPRVFATWTLLTGWVES